MKRTNVRTSHKSEYFCWCAGHDVVARRVKRIVKTKRPYEEYRLECPFCANCFLAWAKFR